MKFTNFFSFVDQIDNMSSFSNIENIKAIYHYSVPNTKLFYPEPFIASPSFMHSDLWFVHILLYQYWLWFVFIFIIVFFFITFLATLRWCNMRVRPRRETRGVSRSKCGDLITATVPVSWATSIIVNESTDAIDYYDGFGTTELVVGIRAYQWGWEYYYPKDVDLNYTLKPNYSIFTGNSLKYKKTNDLFLTSNNLWKFYQNKNFDASVLPLFFLFMTFDNFKLINFLNLNESGLNPLFESNAFKKIRVFSKTFTSNLNYSANNFFFNYNYLTLQYLSASNYSNSFFYGSKKQHNFASTFTILNNQKTFFNLNSVKKFTNRVFLPLNQTSANTSYLNVSNLPNTSAFTSFVQKSLIFENVLKFISLDTDKRNLNNGSSKVFNKNIDLSFKNLFKNYSNKTLCFSEKLFVSKFNLLETFFFNVNEEKVSVLANSNDQNVGSSEKTIRNFLQITPRDSKLNYSSATNDALSSLGKNQNLFDFYQSTSTKPYNLETVFKVINNKIYPDFPYSPVTSARPSTSLLNYDFTNNTQAKTPLILQGKEELVPTALLSIYWNFYWANSGNNIKLENMTKFANKSSFFYLPVFNLYYDYDFRNWQAAELLEDANWEKSFSFYSHFDFLDLKNNFKGYTQKVSQFDSEIARYLILTKKNVTNRSFQFLKTNSLILKTNFFFYDNYAQNVTSLNGKNFSQLINNFLFNNTDEIYENSKFFNNNTDKAIKVSVYPHFNFSQTHHYSFTLDFFRADADENSWFLANNGASSALKSATTVNFLNTSSLSNATILESQNNTNFNQTEPLRFTNFINLRNTAKNAFVTNNAMQKVFKTRFDENRSHAELTDLANSFSSHPFLTTNDSNYTSLLGKNKNAFFNVYFYKNNFKTLFNSLYVFEHNTNFGFFDFPFLIALKSDSSRYLWFDWFAKWGYYEVQPASSSRYAVFGMPYFSKNFEFSTSSNEIFNESENYLIRISRARKNYLPNWTYSPYLYLKNNLWYKQNILFYLNSTLPNNDLAGIFFYLDVSSWYWLNFTLFNNKFALFTPSNSNINSYARNASQNNFSTEGYYSLLSNLADILSKREYLYRELFFAKNKVVTLNSIFSANPKNALFFEIKAALEITDDSSLNNTYSRTASHFSLTLFKNNYFSYLANSSSTTNLIKYLTNAYLLNTDFDATSTSPRSLLFKNQYRPMRKGISNMIRLHATGAMALPIEIRLQVLASSKDVIHSWAIPSAGIKIDCVPGYSSHRVMIFLVSGIYWGQCMEICGRYHHWMPIVVYFMKRDLFFLWCTHFIHYGPNSSLWSANDKNFNDFIKPVSFDKSTWLVEITR